jgi:hypothetical protein
MMKQNLIYRFQLCMSGTLVCIRTDMSNKVKERGGRIDAHLNFRWFYYDLVPRSFHHEQRRIRPALRLHRTLLLPSEDD